MKENTTTLLVNEVPMCEGKKAVGIVGCGIVGGATKHVIEKAGHAVYVQDPAKGYTDLSSLDALAECSHVFFCVPTNSGKDGQVGLFSAVTEICGEYLDLLESRDCSLPVIVIRSTVPAGTMEALCGENPRFRFVYLPEFLRESSAIEDAINPDKIIVGIEYVTERPDESSLACAWNIIDLFGSTGERCVREGRVLVIPFEAAEIAKLALNSLALIKVAFANDLYDLCEVVGIHYDAVLGVFDMDQNINTRHLDAMHGGYRGAGGKCLPKDSEMMLEDAKENMLPFEILKAAVERNRELLEENGQ